MKIKVKVVLFTMTMSIIGCGSGSTSDGEKKDSSTKSETATIETDRLNKDILILDNIAWQDNAEIKNNFVKYGYYQEYCENLVLQGFDDWRLPMISEFSKSLKAKEKFNFLFDDKNYRYWTAQQSTDSQGLKIWIYNFYGKGAYSIKESTLFSFVGTELDTGYNIRCVRDIK